MLFLWINEELTQLKQAIFLYNLLNFNNFINIFNTNFNKNYESKKSLYFR
jgi:hypothetical protein